MMSKNSHKIIQIKKIIKKLKKNNKIKVMMSKRKKYHKITMEKLIKKVKEKKANKKI